MSEMLSHNAKAQQQAMVLDCCRCCWVTVDALQIRESGVPAVVVRPCALTEEPIGAPLEIDQGDVIKVRHTCAHAHTEWCCRSADYHAVAAQSTIAAASSTVGRTVTATMQLVFP